MDKSIRDIYVMEKIYSNVNGTNLGDKHTYACYKILSPVLFLSFHIITMI